jgi:hypothetical protein
MRTGVTHTIYYIMGPVEACETFLRIHHNCNPGLYVLILAALSVQRYSFYITITLKVTVLLYGLAISNLINPDPNISQIKDIRKKHGSTNHYIYRN